MNKKILKLKPVSLPRVKRQKEVREAFSKLNKALREARYKYMLKCWEASEYLTGLQFVQFCKDVARKMVDAGLYASTTGITQTTYSVCHQFYNFDTQQRGSNSNWWNEWQKQRKFHIWDLTGPRHKFKIHQDYRERSVYA